MKMGEFWWSVGLIYFYSKLLSEKENIFLNYLLRFDFFFFFIDILEVCEGIIIVIFCNYF